MHKIKIELEKGVVQNINAYCEWAGLESMDLFLQEAAQYVLKKDKEWQAARKNNN